MDQGKYFARESGGNGVRFINLDAYEMTDRERMHEYIASMFGISPYGNSLDTMLVALTSLKFEYLIKIKNAEVIESNLGEYGKAFIDVLNVAREMNSLLHIRFLWQTNQVLG